MNRHLDNQAYASDLFTYTSNAGIDRHFIQVPRVPLLTYKGPLAGDKQKPHDIAVRAAVNGTYKKPRKEDQAWADEWMAKHPNVYQLFEEYALKACDTRDKYSAKTIVEIIRWHERVQGGRPFAIANGVTRFMKDRFVREHPEHASLFLRGKKGGAR